ncbi:hypothetical protein MMC32_003295 [Xylographa parallela]|nr:hypothetical protein [Xylographa parallela]
MSGTPPVTDQTLWLTEPSVPVIDINWIEGVLDGTISLPKFQMGDGVCVVDHVSDEELGHGPQLSLAEVPTSVRHERGAGERERHTAYEDIIDTFGSCVIPPLLSTSTINKLLETGNSEECESNTECPATPTSDEQWEDVCHLLPLKQGQSQSKPDCLVDTKASIIPSVSGPSKHDHGSRTPGKIGATPWHDQLGPEDDNDLTCATMGTTNRNGTVPGPTTEMTSTSSEVSTDGDEERRGKSIHADTSGPTRLIGMSEDIDWVCICVSDKVARVAKEAREKYLADLTEVLGFLAKGEREFPYQKETNPWMVQLFDERLREAFQRILDDLKCLEEVKRKPKHLHINSRMSDIIKERIDDLGESLVTEVEALMLVKDFLTDMVDHELGTTGLSQRGTKHDFIPATKRYRRPSGGLNVLCLNFVSYLMSLPPQHKMSLPKKNLGPGLRIEGIYYQRFTELPLERWGGLETLLDIHENDAVMNALARSVFRIVASGAYLSIDPATEAEIDEVRLSEVEAAAMLDIWLGERDVGEYSSTYINTYIALHHPHVSIAHRQDEDTVDDITKPSTVKCVCH